jgi:hypothetical protein
MLTSFLLPSLNVIKYWSYYQGKKVRLLAFNHPPDSLHKNLTTFDASAKKLYMTDFIQHIIHSLFPVKAIITSDQRIEIDSLSDLKSYNSANYHIQTS